MEDLAKLDFNKLLNLPSPWHVTSAQPTSETKIDVRIIYDSKRGACPECGKDCKVYDVRPSRSWRHLDTLQYATYLHCEIPRIKCNTCDQVKSLEVPWSEVRNHFTHLFENHVIDVLQASRSVEESRKLLGINWHQLDVIKKRAVARGMSKRVDSEISKVGIDEKSYAKGHQYASIMVDLSDAKVLDIVKGRKITDAKKLIKQGVPEQFRDSVQAVAIDMNKGFQSAVEQVLPKSKIVHDVFHIAQHLNQAVDKTRRAEHKVLLRDDNNSLAKLRYPLLRNSEKLKPDQLDMFKVLKDAGYETANCWRLKELFRCFWRYDHRENAKSFFLNWYEKATKSGLRHLEKVANMINNRLDNVLNFFTHRITNAKAEGVNSKIQTVQSNSRGFRSFENLRIAILFYCGKLDLKHHFSH
jgi:transposase